MAAARITTQNQMGLVLERLKHNIAKRTDKLAMDGYYELRDDIANRQWTHLSNPFARKNFRTVGETGASVASVYYYLTNGDSNYEMQKGETLAKMDGVPRYGGRPNPQLIFEQHVPKPNPHEYVAGWASMSLIVAWWEYGHNNVFTGRRESAPVISYVLFAMKNRALSYYQNIFDSQS